MGYLMVNIQLPDAASMQRTDVVTRKGGRNHRNHEEVEFITTARVQPALQQHVIQCRLSFSSPSRIGACGSKDRQPAGGAAMNREFFMGVNEAQVFAFGPPPFPDWAADPDSP
jgi:HAE1 family hydrophobic/amphiphilic exporter-1